MRSTLFDVSFEGFESNIGLSSLTNPSWVGNTDGIEVVAAEDKIHPTTDAFRAFGPDLTTTTDGYVSVVSRLEFSGGTSDRVSVLAHYDGSNWGALDGYRLDIDLGDGWRLSRIVGGSESFLDFDTSFVSNNSITASSVLDLMLQATTRPSDVLLNAWIRIDDGSVQQVVSSHQDTNASRVTAIGIPGAVMRETAQRIDRMYAYVEGVGKGAKLMGRRRSVQD